jgi:hypothetical protein
MAQWPGHQDEWYRSRGKKTLTEMSSQKELEEGTWSVV